jgi:hypothetical protein
MKNVPKDRRHTYKEPDDLYNCLNHIRESDNLIYGYTYFPSYSLMIAKKLRRFVSIDGSHSKFKRKILMLDASCPCGAWMPTTIQFVSHEIFITTTSVRKVGEFFK